MPQLQTLVFIRFDVDSPVPEAGREMFIVLNHNLEDLDRDNEFHSEFAEFSFKFNYTFRF